MAILGDLEIDVVDSDKPIYSNTVTQKPIENETDISDHIKHDPIEINLKCLFAGNDAMEKHSQLVEMREQEEVFIYDGSFGVYENMAIVEVMPMKNSKYGNGYECDITLRQIRVVELEIAEITLGIDPVTGAQPQNDSDEKEQRDDKSEDRDEETIDGTTLKNLKDMIGEWLFAEEGE